MWSSQLWLATLGRRDPGERVHEGGCHPQVQITEALRVIMFVMA